MSIIRGSTRGSDMTYAGYMLVKKVVNVIKYQDQKWFIGASKAELNYWEGDFFQSDWKWTENQRKKKKEKNRKKSLGKIRQDLNEWKVDQKRTSMGLLQIMNILINTNMCKLCLYSTQHMYKLTITQ